MPLIASPRRPLPLRSLALALSLALTAPVLHADDATSAPDATKVKNLEGVQTTATVTGDGDSYTTKAASGATRLPLSLRETPQSVSVVTDQQMKDFNLTNINAVLDTTTGVNVERVETDRTYYTARGFDITNFLVDGVGVPFANGEQEGDIDTALYQRIEVLRGANGLLSFTGNPSATINFVRKRPTADFEGNVGLTVGSWDNRRLDVDLSGPLNDSHSVRGRFIAAGQDTDSYLDRYNLRKQVLGGIVEADLGSSTLLTAGVTYQKNKTHGGMWGALPLYNTDGTPTDYSRDTSTSADWSRWNIADTRTFVELTQQLGNDWSLKGSLNYRRIAENSNLFYVYGTPDAQTGLGLYAYPSAYTSNEKQYVADLYATGPFELAGRKHELVLGANWAKDDVHQLSSYGEGIGTPLAPLTQWTGDYPEPPFDASYGQGDFHIKRKSLYATARWSLADPVTLITGASLVHIEQYGQNYGVPSNYEKTESTPFVGLVYDFAKNYSAYVSYAKLFNPQTQTDINNKVLDPVTGANLEIGVKGEWYDGRLNATFALFRSRQDGLANYAGHNMATNQDYYTGINAISKGYEFDVSGQITDNWQLSGGYTQLGLVDPEGHNVRTYVPRRLFRLNTTYRFDALPGLRVGGTLRWQDRIYRDQQAVALNGSEIFTNQGSYAVLGLMAGYDFDQHWSTTFNIDNVTNRKYITSLYWAQGLYSAPRNYMLNVRYAF
ncbi:MULTISPECIES: TonB-dependent siderophore receptor [unclassified Dyella]|uniref:TonB-dependent siderophore receptor n=1 Tax=unclassified Dyella TaxID=2634549 RepID=UPI000C826AEA|nr:MULTISPECIES: TonB-dependent siderophore receptor [unclassified Dyella]MDR3444337.1 TonB-dependent siderophore receptor [Dyella sp.]PMQ06082.1 FhuE receptor [Dyella sp. AD56]